MTTPTGPVRIERRVTHEFHVRESFRPIPVGSRLTVSYLNEHTPTAWVFCHATIALGDDDDELANRH